MYEAYTRMDHYEPDYIKRCENCETKFETNDAEQMLCYECEQTRDNQIIIAGEILELISQIEYDIDGQDYFVRKLEILIKEIE